METFVNLLQSFPDDMGVDLRRRNLRMPEHHLNGAQVRTSFEKVRCKGMPEHMG